MKDIGKKVLWLLLIGFVLYYLITQPAAAAAFVRSIADGIGSIFTFFGSLAAP
ncbi:hypothetical protein [Granulicoccus phenolivorans]|uniref:hypothetical protein n=1 Tax=Granulicoccus phenolivorans TaxID=266854 RepID=UPI000410EE60|nr:hypothetical protein [Granulicoccus phenolivorans]